MLSWGYGPDSLMIQQKMKSEFVIKMSQFVNVDSGLKKIKQNTMDLKNHIYIRLWVASV